MIFKVLSPKPLSPEGEAILAAANIEVIRGSGSGRENLLRDIAEVDAIVVWLPEIIDKEVIDTGKNLKLISRFGVGLETIDVSYAQSKGIIVCNTPTSNSNAVAEHAMFLILSCARNAHFADSRMHAGEFKSIWERSCVELTGSTLGIIGPGRIAGLLAKMAKQGFGMRVIAYNPHDGAKVPEGMEKVAGIDELLERSDFVSLHTPATSETTGMIGMAQLKKMKTSAFLINTARGCVVREGELIQALKEGVIRGAGLDVFEKEPPDADNPLFKLDNVILTPHYATITENARVNSSVDVAESIVAVSRFSRPKYELRVSSAAKQP